MSELDNNNPETIEKEKNDIKTLANEIKAEVESEVELEKETTEEVIEEKELTEEEKKEIYIEQLKKSRIRFNKIHHDGNVTTNQFGSKYQKKRQRKNKMAKASRRKNRK